MAEASIIARQGHDEEEANPIQWALDKGRKAWNWITYRFSSPKECANCGKRALYHLPNDSIFCYCSEECYTEFSNKADSIRREEPLCCLPGCPRPCYRDKVKGLFEFCCRRHLILFREKYQSTELYMILKRQKETVYVGQLPKRLRKQQSNNEKTTVSQIPTATATATTSVMLTQSTSQPIYTHVSSPSTTLVATHTIPTPVLPAEDITHRPTEPAGTHMGMPTVTEVDTPTDIASVPSNTPSLPGVLEDTPSLPGVLEDTPPLPGVLEDTPSLPGVLDMQSVSSNGIN
jgi:hypothetical protein